MAKARVPTNRRKADSHQKQSTARQRREASKEVVQRRQKRRERKIVRKKVNIFSAKIYLVPLKCICRRKHKLNLTAMTKTKIHGHLIYRN